MSQPTATEWWIYTAESWPEPTAGPFARREEACRVAIFERGYDDYVIASTDTANELRGRAGRCQDG